MPDVSSPRIESHKEPVLTLRVTEDTAIRIAVLAVVAGVLLILAIRPWEKSQPASVPAAQQLSVNQPETLGAEMSLPSAAPRQTKTDQPDEPAQKAEYNYSVAVHEEVPSPMPIRVLVPPSDAASFEPLPDAGPQPDLAAKVELQPIVPLISLGPTVLHGAGAIFPYSLYRKWFEEIHRVNPQIDINYQGVGSGGGIRQAINGAIDFGATDVPVTDDQLSQSHEKIVQIPTVLGGVVPIYNLPSIDRPVRFTPAALAGIYLGKITSWNDPEIANANPGLNLLPIPIVMVHRSDGASTTFVFTDYLSKVSAEWLKTAGRGTSVKWTAGLGAKGNEGVAALVHQMEGAVGYVDFIYAAQNQLPFGSVQNPSGRFVKASADSITASAAAIGDVTPNLRVSITNVDGANSYPISCFTWLLIPTESREPAKRQALISTLNWMLHEGQSMALDLHYVPLPRNVAMMARHQLVKLQ